MFPCRSAHQGLVRRAVAVRWLFAGFLAVTLLLGSRPASAATADLTCPGGQCRSLFLPVAVRPAACPTASQAAFDAIPFVGAATNRPAALHADLNLGLRGYAPTVAALQLIDYNGATDPEAPQLRGLFADSRTPTFTQAYEVYNWDWACGTNGCRGSLLTTPPVTLLAMGTTRGEPIRIPSRPSTTQIYGGGYMAMVLYAEATRITLKYTREDNVVWGYTVHIDNVCVDPNLLKLYNDLNAAGRPALPALRNGQALGSAGEGSIAVAIRDNGTFMDTRARKDWWR